MDSPEELRAALDAANLALHELVKAGPLDAWGKANLTDALDYADRGMALLASAAARDAKIPPSGRSSDPQYACLVPSLPGVTFATLRRRLAGHGVPSPT